MKQSKKNAFTLIELVAVLVIMAIIALIVTPLVMSIIRKARISADKRSIDAYGRSIELAIAGYLMDTGSFPTDINQLTIEYSGDEVVCTTTNLNSDSSVYLAGCTVGGRSVDGYTYGKGGGESSNYEAYSIGDTVTYNGINYYVIENSGATKSTVTLLKETPITSSEISSYLSSTEIANKVDTSGTYATMPYYSRDNCVSAGDQSGCSTDYSVSDVKQLVDVWKSNYANGATEARLITINELEDNFAYEYHEGDTSVWYEKTSSTPSWVYNSNYYYWTMSQYQDSASDVWNVGRDGSLHGDGVDSNYVVRPVIIISKSNLSS